MNELSAHSKKFQKELNAGIYSLVLLNVLNTSQEPMYGYQIARMLEQNSSDEAQMKQGTLYPVLRSLEENGLLTSLVEPSVSGPPRKYYSITPQGREALREWVQIWQQTRDFVNAIVKG